MANRSSTIIRTKLPISRVKRISRLDSPNGLISAEALQLMTIATENFISLLARAAYSQVCVDKRKTLQFKDLEFCIKNYSVFNFLDEALDGWPEPNAPKPVSTEGGTSGAAEAVALDEEEMDEILLEVDDDYDEMFGFDESIQADFPLDGRNIVGQEVSVERPINAADAVLGAMEVEDQTMDGGSNEPAQTSEIIGQYGYSPLIGNDDAQLPTNSGSAISEAKNDVIMQENTDSIQSSDTMVTDEDIPELTRPERSVFSFIK